MQTHGSLNEAFRQPSLVIVLGGVAQGLLGLRLNFVAVYGACPEVGVLEQQQAGGRCLTARIRSLPATLPYTRPTPANCHMDGLFPRCPRTAW